MSRHPFIILTLSHLKEFLREPGSVFWSFGFPILMAIGLGLAFSGKKEITHGVGLIATAESGSQVSTLFFGGDEPRDTVIEKEFENENGKTRYIFHITSWDNAEVLMKRGIISSILTEDKDKITYHYDPMNPEGELIQIQLSNFFRDGDLGRDSGSIEPLKTQGMRYIDFLIPGLLSLGVMMSIMWGVCYSLIEKRSKKLLRRMVATPMKKTDFMTAYWASRLILTLFDSLVLLVFSYFFFGVVVQGSIMALALILLAGNIGFFGMAILISSRTANTQVGNGLISLITTPMMVLSGIFFSYQNFPPWAVDIIKFLPLTKFTDEVRGIINEGARVVDVLDGVAVLGLFGLITFVIGLRIYKWF
ncbi:MAG: ABC transporter permease [Bacteroidales bacterium]|nr:ABC transporter permease [Bacteroidales bacterium]